MGIFNKYSRTCLFLVTSLLITSLAACGNNSDNEEASASLAITSTAPAADATGVGTNIKVVAVFNKAVSSATLTQSSFTLQGQNETAIVGSISYNAATMTAILTPNGALTASTQYTATVTTEVETASDNALANDVEWVFTTGLGADNDAPAVSSTSPSDGAVGVLLNTKVIVVFSEAMDPATLTASSFKLEKDVGSAVVPGSLRYVNPTTLVFSPTANLDASTDYTLTLSAAIADIAGNDLALATVGFTTGTEVSSSSGRVELGTAGNYVLLAKTGITTTGTTDITGDIAVSPESMTAITGFSLTADGSGTFSTSALVTGNVYAANSTSPTPAQLTTAVGDMMIAFTDAAGRSNPDFTELGTGEIGGLTLDPGLYKWSTGVLVTSDVTLNGSATDVWIFQIAQDLKLEEGKAVVLTGGALPKNVFWQVEGEATLQAGATFNGIILSQTAIVLKSGAVLNGRALAQTAVTLIANTITEPAD